MCGIFCYIGKKTNAAEIIFNGLKTLEYRGYDSWGIAAQQKTKIIIDKHTGKISNSILSSKFSGPGSLAIGHTRWATHGGVTPVNTHPHLDCTGRISVLHNGIIENYQELKKELIAKNHAFTSETDTEVIAHLLEEYSIGNTFLNAMKKTFKRLAGLNAVVAIHTGNDEIIAAKNGSPLIAGIGNDEFFLASDAAGILPYTKKVIFLKDNELISLNKHYNLYSLTTGKEIKPKIQKLNWKFEDAQKGKYPHFLLKEINDQRISIADAVTQNEKQLMKLVNLIDKSYGTYFVGCGTAAHACRMATYIFSVIAKKHINFCVGSEFSYYEHFLTSKSLLVAATQSGETIDLIDAVAAARRHSSKIAALVNVVGSTIYRESDLVLPLRAGFEKAVLSTKAFTNKLAIFYLLAFSLIGEYQKGRKKLLETANAVGKLLDNKKLTQQIKKIAEKIYKSHDIYILGRGLSYPLALEAAHKIKEASYIHAEGFAGGEPKHCEISLISKGTPAIVFVPNDETKEAIISNAIEFKSRGAYIIGISPDKHNVFDEWIQVPDLGITSPIVNIIPAQLLAYYLSLKKGNDPDKPRNLAKSVTVK